MMRYVNTNCKRNFFDCICKISDEISFQNVQKCYRNVSTFQPGDKLGVKRCEEELHFLVNGNRVARLPLESKDDDIYGVVDVFGKTIRVSIIGQLLSIIEY